ncbi:hypothetical protein [Limnoraphis robusta]|uniref:Uncharacterized protein n=1 Tax=Limnoraphis robusta CCNP1315 TaxID=3110306 RepID=A0ABU5TZZ5_9CYAN|nr:hypothetical protein [Limnoraphis robusta]MEA5520508.1 hypothetical protein [Limnoraphis robusta CCNP1315]MEA5547021.1 hypothetical protein [Limnoraphis robusta CCNP1324]
MQPKKILSLVVVPLFYLGLTCFVPKKATAEIIETALGNIPIACDTDTQKCYTPQNGGWAYVGTINDVSRHQYNAETCMRALGNSMAAAMTRGIDCSIYGIPQNRAAEEQWDRIQDQVLDLLN